MGASRRAKPKIGAFFSWPIPLGAALVHFARSHILSANLFHLSPLHFMYCFVFVDQTYDECSSSSSANKHVGDRLNLQYTV